MIFDASAVLAAVRQEPGADVVNAALDDGAISAVNWLEVLASVLRGPEHELAVLERIRLTLLPFDGGWPFVRVDSWLSIAAGCRSAIAPASRPRRRSGGPSSPPTASGRRSISPSRSA